MSPLPRRFDILRPLAAVLATFFCLAVLGCSPASPPAPSAARPAPEHGDHDHAATAATKNDQHDHEHPETLAAGVAAVGKLWTGIKASLKDGKMDAADDMVHEVGHLLEDLPDLLAKTKPAADVAEAGKKAIDEVSACFETIDTALHAGEEEAKKIDLDGLTTRIEAAFASLSALVK